MNNELPEGWSEVSVAELLTDFRTGPFGSALYQSDYVENGIPVINPTNLFEGRIRPSRLNAVNRTTFERLKEYALCEGDVIIARRGEMGRCAVVSATENGWLCGTGSAILRLPQGLPPEFMQMLLASPAVRSYRSSSRTEVGPSVGGGQVIHKGRTAVS
jgi:type I restriction enzyme S subunit